MFLINASLTLSNAENFSLDKFNFEIEFFRLYVKYMCQPVTVRKNIKKKTRQNRMI